MLDVVVPAKAGSQRLERSLKSLAPAFAGVTIGNIELTVVGVRAFLRAVHFPGQQWVFAFCWNRPRPTRNIHTEEALFTPHTTLCP